MLKSPSRLRAEVERAIDRLNVQRETQLQECAAFEQKLHENIHAMIAMQQSVRRRAQALEAGFDASVQRLNTVFLEAVAKRRAQGDVGSLGSVAAQYKGVTSVSATEGAPACSTETATGGSTQAALR